MEINIKKLDPNAVIPRYASVGDAGMDLYATSVSPERAPFVEFGTGLAIEIPEGYVGLIYPRSSISKTKYTLANSVGVIDSGYRGEIKLRFRIEFDLDAVEYKLGDRIGQIVIMPYPQVQFKEVQELMATGRGDGGFGSTGQ